MDKTRKPYPTKARERIKSGMILKKLEDHVNGEVELSNTQIQAARILLSKTLPDLTAVAHSGEISSKTEKEMTRDELLRIAASGSAGVAGTPRRTNKPAPLH